MWKKRNTWTEDSNLVKTSWTCCSHHILKWGRNVISSGYDRRVVGPDEGFRDDGQTGSSQQKVEGNSNNRRPSPRVHLSVTKSGLSLNTTKHCHTHWTMCNCIVCIFTTTIYLLSTSGSFLYGIFNYVQYCSLSIDFNWLLLFVHFVVCLYCTVCYWIPEFGYLNLFRRSLEELQCCDLLFRM